VDATVAGLAQLVQSLPEPGEELPADQVDDAYDDYYDEYVDEADGEYDDYGEASYEEAAEDLDRGPRMSRKII
jgi:hypothetical protein